MPAGRSKKPKGRTTRKKKPQPPLKGFLSLLVILLSLAIIALAASHIYVRMNKNSRKEASAEPVVEKTEKNNASKPSSVVGDEKSEAHKAPPVEKIFTGTWVSSSNGAMLSFKGNRYSLDLPSVEDNPAIKGSFSVSDGIVTFEIAEGPSNCVKTLGRYAYQMNGDNLRLKLVSDDCSKQANQLKSNFFRFD